MRELFARLFDWLRRDRLDAELTEELSFHRPSSSATFRVMPPSRDDAWAT